MRTWLIVLALSSALLAPSASAIVLIDWVTVGNPGNACHPFGTSAICVGAVATPYRIGRFEVTNAQYAEFLNAVAALDSNDLWHVRMEDVNFRGGILRFGGAGAHTYAAIAGREELPVNWVSPYDAMRFANWLHNGQPSGLQNAATTEDGAYDMSEPALADIERRATATIFLPSWDEWYKAAYYDPGSATYYEYPTSSDSVPTCGVPSAIANTANCGSAVGDLTAVGAYPGSPGPYGTFNQYGNVSESTDTVHPNTQRKGMGTYWSGPPITNEFTGTGNDIESALRGFRVAALAPAEPAVPALGASGLVVLGCLTGVLGWRSARSRIA